MPNMSRETVEQIRRYYDQSTGEIPPGTGLVWFMGQDQLHPPMIDDPEVWNTPNGWIQGAKQTVKDLIKLVDVKKDDLVLEIGCGVGGAGRIVTEETGARVIELNLSHTQLVTNRFLSDSRINTNWQNMQYLQANGCEVPLPNNYIDKIVSINMFYHFPDPEMAIREFSRSLKPGGKVGLDDWFLTDKATNIAKAQLQHEWSSPEGFHRYNDVIGLFEKYDFIIRTESDLTAAGIKYISKDFFGKVFDDFVAPLIIANFPRIYQYDGYEPSHAIMAVNQLKNAVMLMGELYRSGQAVYKQIVAEKL